MGSGLGCSPPWQNPSGVGDFSCSVPALCAGGAGAESCVGSSRFWKPRLGVWRFWLLQRCFTCPCSSCAGLPGGCCWLSTGSWALLPGRDAERGVARGPRCCTPGCSLLAIQRVRGGGACPWGGPGVPVVPAARAVTTVTSPAQSCQCPAGCVKH